jgi:hypothetical protein
MPALFDLSKMSLSSSNCLMEGGNELHESIIGEPRKLHNEEHYLYILPDVTKVIKALH